MGKKGNFSEEDGIDFMTREDSDIISIGEHRLDQIIKKSTIKKMIVVANKYDNYGKFEVSNQIDSCIEKIYSSIS